MLKRWNNLSLRLRLTVLYIGLLSVLLVALGSFLYFDTRSFLISSTTLRLRTQAQPGAERLSRGGFLIRISPDTTPGGASPPRIPGANPPNLSELAGFFAQSQTSAGTTAAVYDKDGKLLADGRTLPEQPISAPADGALIARAASGEEDIHYITTVSGQDTLVILIPLHRPSFDTVPTGVLQLSARLDLVDAVLSRQLLLIAIGVVVTLILGTVGGLWLTGSTLAPLEWMIVTCRRIAGGDLSQRVNLPQRRDEIGQLASTFDEMVARLEETFAAQRQFVADASHELRTPLTAIAGSLDVLLLGPEGDPQTTHRMLNGMRREVQRLTRLVTDLLMLTRLDARQGLNRQTVDLASLAREVAEQMKPVAGSRVIQVENTGDTRVQGDPDRLKQVLLNLVVNAVRFTDPESGVIRLGVNQLERDVRLTVSDNGSGIPPEAQSHLFERFYRVDKARARTPFDPAGSTGPLRGHRSGGGSGLGLAIVKAIVDAHGGAIEPVKSAPGQGSVFTLLIPRGAVPAQKPA